MVKQIPTEVGVAALNAWKENCATPAQLRTAVRYTLQFFAELHPGRSVELRVPPAGAVQVLRGTNHRRGTPPAVVEMNSQTWLSLVTARITWAEAAAAGAVDASGERADLSQLLPIPGL